MIRTSSGSGSADWDLFSNQLPRLERLSSPTYFSGQECKKGEAPLFGNYQQLSSGARSNKNQSSSRHHIGGSCGRWPSIPAGTDACLMKPGSGSKRLLPHYQASQFLPQYYKQNNHERICVDPCSSSSLGKKQYYNLMWDPHIVRGPNSIQFTVAQRAKCERAMDINKNIIFKHRLRRSFLDKGGNSNGTSSGKGAIDPTVRTNKEPLCYQSFLPFLTDPEIITKKDAFQSMNDDWPSCCAPRLPEPKVKFSEGLHKILQTETSPCKQDTSKWIVDSLLDKIPQQALLEVAEETELEVLRGERQRHEMVLVYTKWQKIKEDQWNEYLQAWNELRMKEICEEDYYLQDQGDGRIGAVTFAKNALKCCFTQTFELMKQDRFICKEGVPYKELMDVEKIMENRKRTRDARGRIKLAKNIVDSAIAKSVINRFAQHMNDEFGKPHGKWLSTDLTGAHADPTFSGNHLPLIEYDEELKKYLEGRNKLRKKSIRGTVGVRSDASLFNIFDKSLQEHGSLGRRLVSHDTMASFDFPKLQKLFQPRMKSINFGNTLGVELGDGGEEGKSRENSFDVTLVYRRKTSWSKLENDDERQREQQQQKEEGKQDKREPSGSRGVGGGAIRSSGDKTQKVPIDDDDDHTYGGLVKVETEDTDKLNEDQKRGSDP